MRVEVMAEVIAMKRLSAGRVIYLVVVGGLLVFVLSYLLKYFAMIDQLSKSAK